MKHSSIPWLACGLAAVALMFTARPAWAADDPIAAARDLYSAAAYEEALAVLDGLAASNGQPPQRTAIDQYRAFCLLALGRTTDAERAIEAVVSAEPLYNPSDKEASPRVRSAFASVRQRMLPIIVQQKYADAKSAYDRQNFAAAASGFEQVLEGLADPALSAAGQVPPLSDLRTLAMGFRELSVRAATPPPAPAPVVPAVAAAAPPPVLAPRIYAGDDASVAPPAVVRQDLPRLISNGMLVGRKGMLEVVINESGLIESAMMRTRIDPRYDSQVLSATKNWKYKPASVAGQPVKFRKLIVIEVKGLD